jgi:hypothetical protein
MQSTKSGRRTLMPDSHTTKPFFKSEWWAFANGIGWGFMLGIIAMGLSHG